MKDEKRKEVQFCYLTKEEMNDPSGVIKGFTEDISLEAARKTIVTMRDVCSTTDNIPYGDPKAREDLFYVTDKMLRFFEASYVVQKKANFPIQMKEACIRRLRVLEKGILKNVSGVPNTVPCLSLYGRWLASAGFYPGSEVTIATEQEQMFIATARKWDEIINSAKQRA